MGENWRDCVDLLISVNLGFIWLWWGCARVLLGLLVQWGCWEVAENLRRWWFSMQCGLGDGWHDGDRGVGGLWCGNWGETGAQKYRVGYIGGMTRAVGEMGLQGVMGGWLQDGQWLILSGWAVWVAVQGHGKGGYAR